MLLDYFPLEHLGGVSQVILDLHAVSAWIYQPDGRITVRDIGAYVYVPEGNINLSSNIGG